MGYSKLILSLNLYFNYFYVIQYGSTEVFTMSDGTVIVIYLKKY